MAQAARQEGGDALLDLEQNHDEPRPDICTRFQVGIVFVIFVTFRAADRVFSKALNTSLNSTVYIVMWQNILWPFAIQIMTVFVIVGYVMLQRWQGNAEYNLRFFMPRNPLASSRGAIPMHQMALFSLGDQLQAALQAAPSAFLALTVQNVISSFVIIWIAMVAYFWIKTRYKQVHFVGMILVVLAAVVQLAPFITNNDCTKDALQSEHPNCFKAYKNSLGQWTVLSLGQMILWYTMFLFSTAPGAVSNVYKQKVLQGCDADIFFVTFWSGWWQMLWGWLCVPLLWLPIPGQISPSETFGAIADTLSCFAGNVPHVGDESCAASPAPWVWMVAYLGFNLAFNLCILWLTKRMSAAWTQVATGVCLNLSDIFGSLKFIAGSSAQPMSLHDWLATGFVTVSLWVYNLEPEVKANDGGSKEKGVGDMPEKVAGVDSSVKKGSSER